jgi:hypothetical protein
LQHGSELVGERRKCGTDRQTVNVESRLLFVEAAAPLCPGSLNIAFPQERGTVMSKLLASIGLGLMLASTAATAADSNPKATNKPATASPDQTYCIRLEPDTGSHYVRTECHTKAEWARLGVDVDELIKK